MQWYNFLAHPVDFHRVVNVFAVCFFFNFKRFNLFELSGFVSDI